MTFAATITQTLAVSIGRPEWWVCFFGLAGLGKHVQMRRPTKTIGTLMLPATSPREPGWGLIGDALFWRSGVCLYLTQTQRIPEFTRGASRFFTSRNTFLRRWERRLRARPSCRGIGRPQGTK